MWVVGAVGACCILSTTGMRLGRASNLVEMVATQRVYTPGLGPRQGAGDSDDERPGFDATKV